MNKVVFTEKDKAQLANRGISLQQARRQVEWLVSPPYRVVLDRPAIAGDGLRVMDKAGQEKAIALCREAQQEGRFTKFVPASGAASRMFKALLQAPPDAQVSPESLAVLDKLDRFAFYEKLAQVVAQSGQSLESLRSRSEAQPIWEALLGPSGLNYARLPKGLLLFHRYPEGSRTAFEEHLVEAVSLVKDAKAKARIHLTVSPEQEVLFSSLIKSVRSRYEALYKTRFEVTFSSQSPSTDTLAVDANGEPFREEKGSLHLRPGGHGALIENLDHLKADCVFIKNIDNVVPDHLKEPVIRWKQVLAGVLIDLQGKIHSLLHELDQGAATERWAQQALDFLSAELLLAFPKALKAASVAERVSFIRGRLDRPLRVCGMVKNEGEPGGGPFWVRDPSGSCSLQIIESAQVDAEEKQQALFSEATHFNPVDLVCGLRDHCNRPYPLRDFVNSEAVFISHKSYNGKELKALELPGLWNGAQAYWNTVFIEVPVETFHPVKTLNDLLRPSHQPPF